jgi:transmembrane sensor
MINEELKQLYRRYLDNDLSKEELNQFLALLQSRDNEMEVDKAMSETWDHMFGVTGINKAKTVSLTKIWYRVAAAIIILLMIGAGTYFLFFNQSPEQNMTKIEKGVMPDVKAPGTARALLKLNDGTIIYLDSVRNGSLAVQGNVDILKTGDGQLVYDSHHSTRESTSTLYNTLVNPRGSKVVSLSLSDGTRVWLNSESSLRYPASFSGDERKVEITGESYFEVATLMNANEKKTLTDANEKRLDANKIPFIVEHNGLEVEVLGTHFNVNAYGDEDAIRVTLLEGSVNVKRQSSILKLEPGEQAIAKTNSLFTIDHSADIEKVMAWKNGMFSYHNSDLETIMRQMARWYDVEVIYRERIKDHYTVDISRNVPASQLFKFIEMSGGVHFEIEGKKIIVKK